MGTASLQSDSQFGRWSSIAMSALSILVLVLGFVAFVRHGMLFGWHAAFTLVAAEYSQTLRVLVGWSEPYLSRLGQLPFWWREGMLMLGLVLGQWWQVIRDRRAKVSEALEFFGTALITGAATYAIDVAQDPLQASFFGIAGVFVQLLVRGSISFLRDSPDGEAWAGRYLLRSVTIVLIGGFVIFASNAGQGLM